MKKVRYFLVLALLLMSSVCAWSTIDSRLTLTSLKYNGISVPDFDPQNNVYLIRQAGILANGIPNVTYTKNNSSTVDVLNTEMDNSATAAASILLYLPNDPSTNVVYSVSFIDTSVRLSDNADLASLKVNGVDFPGFDPNITFYVYELPANSPAPVVTVTKADQSSTYTIDYVGVAPFYTAEVTVEAENGKEKKYSVLFTGGTRGALSPVSTLNWIKYDGTPVPNFDPEKTAYVVKIAQTAPWPTLTYQLTDSRATVTDVIQPSDAAGGGAITVFAQDGWNNHAYMVIFNRHVPDPSDATLQSLTCSLGDIPLEASETDYYFNLPPGTYIMPTVDATPTEDGATVSITQASWNDMIRMAEITVTSSNGQNERVYSVYFEPAENDASIYKITCGSNVITSSSHRRIVPPLRSTMCICVTQVTIHLFVMLMLEVS